MTSITFYNSFVPLLAFILLLVNLIFAPSNPYMQKNGVFECGFTSFLGQNRTQFSISFFIFALLFLLFDLEILLVYPYLVSSYTNELYGLIIILLFLLALTLGFAYELGKKALSIESRQKDYLDIKMSSNYNLVKSGVIEGVIPMIEYMNSLNEFTFSIPSESIHVPKELYHAIFKYTVTPIVVAISAGVFMLPVFDENWLISSWSQHMYEFFCKHFWWEAKYYPVPKPIFTLRFISSIPNMWTYSYICKFKHTLMARRAELLNVSTKDQNKQHLNIDEAQTPEQIHNHVPNLPIDDNQNEIVDRTNHQLPNQFNIQTSDSSDDTFDLVSNMIDFDLLRGPVLEISDQYINNLKEIASTLFTYYSSEHTIKLFVTITVYNLFMKYHYGRHNLVRNAPETILYRCGGYCHTRIKTYIKLLKNLFLLNLYLSEGVVKDSEIILNYINKIKWQFTYLIDFLEDCCGITYTNFYKSDSLFDDIPFMLKYYSYEHIINFNLIFLNVIQHYL